MRLLSLIILLYWNTVLPINAELVCLESLGRYINPSDCSAAMLDLRYSSILHDFDHPQPRYHTFGAGRLVNRRYRVPQGYPHGTCSIGFDLIGVNPASRQETWETMWKNLGDLIKTCVENGNGVGGIATENGFGFIILDPRQVDLAGTCMAAPPSRTTDIIQCALQRADLQSSQSAIVTEAQRQRQAHGLNPAPPHNLTAQYYGRQAAVNQTAFVIAQLQQEVASGIALRAQAAGILQAQQPGPSVPNFPYPGHQPASVINSIAANRQPQGAQSLGQRPSAQLSPHEIAVLAASAVTAYSQRKGQSPPAQFPPGLPLPQQPPPGYLPPGYPPPRYPPPGYSPPGYLPPGYSPQGPPQPGYLPPGYSPPGPPQPVYSPPGPPQPVYPSRRPFNSSSSQEPGAQRIIWAKSPRPSRSFPAFGPKPNLVQDPSSLSLGWTFGAAFLSVNRASIPSFGAGFPVFQGDAPGSWVYQDPGTWRELSNPVTKDGAWKPLLPKTPTPQRGAWIFTSNVNVPRSKYPSPGKAIVKSSDTTWQLLGPSEPIPSTGAWIRHGGVWTRLTPDQPNQPNGGSWVLDRQMAIAAANRALHPGGGDPTTSSSSGINLTRTQSQNPQSASASS